MSNFTFRPSVRENAHVIGGLMGGTGSGKTFSALRLATGLAGGKKFAVIDTEARRALHYADAFSFDHGDLKAPFTPDAYLEAIVAAEAAGYPVVVVDSMSHEHAGEGGLLDWHESEVKRMGGDDYKKREQVKFAAWIKPKGAHNRMISRLLQLRTHLILCFRAAPKMKPQKDPRTGRTEFVDAGWLPICAKGLEFELTFSFLLHHETPGLPSEPLKLPEALRSYFPANRAIDEDSGARLAEWAAGGVSAADPAAQPAAPEEVITESQAADLEAKMQEAKVNRLQFFSWLQKTHGVMKLEEIPGSKLASVVRMLERKLEQSA